MAVITEPGVVTIFAADGKLAGPVMVHIRRTAAFRRAYPKKNLTVPQKRATTAFAYIDGLWKVKSQGDRDLWNRWRKWEKKYGYNQFQRVNIPRRLAGLPLYTDPPTLWP